MIFAPFAFKNFTVSDVNARNFINAAGITNQTQKIAINTLVTDLKTNNLWTKMFVIYPFVGGTSTTTKYNLVDPTTYTITWNGGITFASTGVQGNGSTGYGDTGWIPKVFNSGTTITGSLSYSIYSRTNTAVQGDDTEIGVGRSQAAIQILARRLNGNAILDNYNASNGRINATVSNSQGLYFSTRTATNSMKAFKNGTQLGTTNTTAATTTNITADLDISLFLLAQNFQGAASSYSRRELAFAHIGAGLDDSESSTFYTIVQNFQTALGRQV